MTIDPQVQKLQDMLNGAINQRNASQNECLQLSGDLREALRKVEEQATQIKELTEKLAAAEANAKPEMIESVPKTNGRHAGKGNLSHA